VIQRKVRLVFWSYLTLAVAVACGKSERSPRPRGDTDAGQSGSSGTGGRAGTGGAAAGRGPAGGAPNGGANGVVGGIGGRATPSGGAGNAGQPAGAGPVAGSAGQETGGTGGDAGEDGGGVGPGGEGGRGDVPGFDDLIVRSTLMGEFEGRAVHASLRRLLPRATLVLNGDFEIRWDQTFDRTRFGYILLLFVDLDEDGTCTQGSDPAWARHINNPPETGPVIHEFDPNAQGGGFPPNVTCADLEDL
jgi:hypothetical protein